MTPRVEPGRDFDGERDVVERGLHPPVNNPRFEADVREHMRKLREGRVPKSDESMVFIREDELAEFTRKGYDHARDKKTKQPIRRGDRYAMTAPEALREAERRLQIELAEEQKARLKTEKVPGIPDYMQRGGEETEYGDEETNATAAPGSK